MQRHQGTVVWFSSPRGYGFIAPDARLEIPELAEDKDLFVHFSQIDSVERRRNLYENQRVEFDVVEDREHTVMAGAVRVIRSADCAEGA